MAVEKKITKREKYEMAIKMAEAQGNDMLVEFFKHEIELLAKKSSGGSAKKNEEQEAFMDLLRDVLVECTDVRGMRCAAIAKDSRVAEFKWADGKETSPNRVLAYLKKMIEAQDVVRVQDKKEAYFHLA